MQNGRMETSPTDCISLYAQHKALINILVFHLGKNKMWLYMRRLVIVHTLRYEKQFYFMSELQNVNKGYKKCLSLNRCMNISCQLKSEQSTYSFWSSGFFMEFAASIVIIDTYIFYNRFRHVGYILPKTSVPFTKMFCH